MRSGAESILAQLRRVDAQRAVRQADAALGHRVEAVKAYQQERFRRSYADLLASERFGAAARFFLEELYGPGDFSRRDAQFARVVPTLVRLFPADIVETVDALVQLHAATEELDTEMARTLREPTVDRHGYISAWQAVGRESERLHQIELTMEVGRDLDRVTRKPLLRQTLQLMRGPARAAGLSQLQQFLESGFDAFRSMRGSQAFLDTVQARERALVDALFAPDAEAQIAASAPASSALGQLP